MDYLTDKTKKAPYYVTTYYKTEDYSNKDVFKSTFDDYVVFDNIFIDFDNNDKPEDAINQGIRVAKHLKHDLGLDVLVNYSGSKGCHIHLLFNPIELEHPAEVLELFTKQIESNYNVTADPQVYKSLKRLKRIPCSKHNKTGNYAHFIDFEDKTAINTTLNNAEYSPFTIIDNNAKYYIPDVPDKIKNTEIITLILKHLDKLADSSKANANDTTEYDLHIDLDTDNEFINKFKKLYYKGNRWNIGHAVIYMFKRSGWNDAEILNFFDAITPSNIDNDAPKWLNWINNQNTAGKYAGFKYFSDKVTESINQNAKLHGDDKDAVINDYINYFRSVFIADNSIYKIPAGLEKQGYKYDDDALYCPLIPNWYYLKIEREYKNYGYSIVEQTDDGYKIKSMKFTATKSIISEHVDRNKKLGQYVKSINNEYPPNQKPFDKRSLAKALESIAITLANTSNYEQITAEFKVYKDLKESEEVISDTDDVDVPSAKAFNDYPADVQKEAMRLIDNGTLFDNIAKTVKLTHANDSELIDTLILIDGTIYIGTPASSMVGGETGTGKTDVTESVALNYPDNHIFRMRTFSPKYVYYAKDDFNSDYNILVVDDVDLSKRANVEVLKELTDNKKVVKELKTVIDQKAVTFTLTGKFIVILTFAKTQEDAELLNRLFNTGIITDKSKASNVKHKIKSNTIIDADNNLLIKQLQEINKCAITKLIESNYKIFNPYSLFINPEYFNNRDVPAFINLVSANAFYNVANRQRITIGDDTVVLGTIKDIQKVISLWNIKAQKDKLSVRQQDILNLPIPEYTLEEAMEHQQKVIEDYNNSESAGYREALKRKQWSRERIAKELEVSKNTLKFDLDTAKDDKNTKNLLELGLIDRYKFDDDAYNSMWIYYKPKDDNDSKVLKSNLMYWYVGTNGMYQSKNHLNDKISIIINLLYRYNFLINDRDIVYIKNYCSNMDDITNDDIMYKFLNGFFNTYNDSLVKVNDNTSAIDILYSIELMKPYLIVNPEVNSDDDIIFNNPADDDNRDTYNDVPKSADFVPIPKSSDIPLNQNQRKNTLVHPKSTNVTNTKIVNEEVLEDLSDMDNEIFYTLVELMPKSTSKTLTDIKKNYPVNPEEPDEHIILRLEKSISTLVDNGLLVKDTIDGVVQFKINYVESL